MADKERMELKRVAALVLCVAREEKDREDESRIGEEVFSRGRRKTKQRV
jgi:hypothetical protein